MDDIAAIPRRQPPNHHGAPCAKGWHFALTWWHCANDSLPRCIHRRAMATVHQAQVTLCRYHSAIAPTRHRPAVSASTYCHLSVDSSCNYEMNTYHHSCCHMKRVPACSTKNWFINKTHRIALSI
jgi:hypothetical protein